MSDLKLFQTRDGTLRELESTSAPRSRGLIPPQCEIVFGTFAPTPY